MTIIIVVIVICIVLLLLVIIIIVVTRTSVFKKFKIRSGGSAGQLFIPDQRMVQLNGDRADSLQNGQSCIINFPIYYYDI